MNNREYSYPAYVSPEGETYKDVKDAVEPCKCYTIKELLSYASRGMEIPTGNVGEYESEIQGITEEALEDASVNVVEDLTDCDDIIHIRLRMRGVERRKRRRVRKRSVRTMSRKAEIAPKEQAVSEEVSEQSGM